MKIGALAASVGTDTYCCCVVHVSVEQSVQVAQGVGVENSVYI